MLVQEDEAVSALAHKKRTLLQALLPADASESSANHTDAQERTPIHDYIAASHTDPEVTMTFIEDDTQPNVSKSRGDDIPISSSLYRDEPVPAEGHPVVREAYLETLHSPKLTKKDQEPTSSPRSRLDSSGTKRLHFSPPGLRTPSSKDKEENLRNQLVADVSIVATPRKEDANGSAERSVSGPEDSWEEKIDLRAVECCDDGIQLSKPPFPFVQRWDPQQQGSWNGNFSKSGGKRKKRKRNNKQYYQTDDGAYQDNYDGFEDLDWAATDTADAMQLDYGPFAEEEQSGSNDIQAAVDQQILEDTQRQSEVSEPAHGEDLPELPSDLSDYATLSVELAKPGAFIAFKQMEMSERTSWCPIISPYRSAKVVAILDDGMMDVRLAARDVVQEPKKYDEETGERLYGRFEMPGSDNEQDDGSTLQISLQDMIEPKFLQNFEVAEVASASQSTLKTSFQSTGPEKKIIEKEDKKSQSNDSAAVDGFHEISDTNISGKGIENFQASPSPGSTMNGVQKPVEMSESERREYSLLMKDAGFRSDVAEEVNKEIGNGVIQASSAKDVMVYELSAHTEGSATAPQPQIKEYPHPSSEQVASGEAAATDPDQPFEDFNDDWNPLAYESDEGSEDDGNDDEGEDDDRKQQARGSSDEMQKTCTKDASSRSLHQSSAEIEDGNDSKSKIETDACLLDGNTSDEDQPSFPLDLRRAEKVKQEALSPKKTRSDKAGDKGFKRTTELRAFSQPNPRSRNTMFDSDDDEEPTARMSLAFGSEDSLPSLNLTKMFAATAPKSKVLEKSPGLPGRNDYRDRPSPAFEDPEEVDLPKIKISASQKGRSSSAMEPQVIDLTMSSDAIDPDGSDFEYDEKKPNSLPAGPGWVPKTRRLEIKTEKGKKVRELKRTRSNV